MKPALRKSIFTFLFIATAILFIVSCLWNFSSHINNNLKDGIKDELAISTQHSTDNISTKFDDTISSLKTLALTLESINSSITSQSVIDLLHNAAKTLKFTRMSIITPDGIATTSEGNTFDLSYREYVQRALAGETVISNVLQSSIDNLPCIIIAVPVRKDDKVIGVLTATIQTREINKLLDLKSFGTKGKVAVFQNNGDIITMTKDKNMLTYGSIYDLILPDGGDADFSFQELEYNIKVWKSGILHYTHRGIEYYAYHQSTGINDWNVINIVPSSVIQKDAAAILSSATKLNLQLFFILLLVGIYLFILQKRNQQAINKGLRELKTLANSIPGGVAQMKANSDLTILYANDGFYKLTGYTKEEYHNGKLKGRGISLIFDEDLAIIQSALTEHLTYGTIFKIDYRIHKKDGSFAWIAVQASPIAENSSDSILQAVFLDVTEAKKSVQSLEYEKDRYRIISELSAEIMFEYNFNDDVIIHSDRFRDIFGQCPIIKNFKQHLENPNLLIGEYAQEFRNKFNELGKQHPVFLLETKMKTLQNEYEWFSFHGIILFDQNQLPIKLIGKIANIDEQKRATQRLIERAQRDSLTNLYNKISTQTQIEEFIKESAPNSISAFILIDVDNFKAVNDNLGHFYGDEVLKTISRRLMEEVRASDIVGRTGGDEFIVFLKDLGSISHVEKKAEDICNIFRDSYTGEKSDYKISSSIGISVYPKDGNTYELLFQKADYSLYQAKHNGKDCFCSYSREFENR